MDKQHDDVEEDQDPLVNKNQKSYQNSESKPLSNRSNQVSEEDQRKINDKKTEGMMLGIVSCQLICVALVEGLFGYLFYHFSITEKLYHSEDCVHMRKYAHVFGLVAMIISVIWILLLVVGTILKKAEILAGTTALFSWISGIFNFIMFILLFISLAFNEECGKLRSLVLVIFCITIIAIILSCCTIFIMMMGGKKQ